MPIWRVPLAMSALGSSHISRVQRGAQALMGRMILSARVAIPFAAAAARQAQRRPCRSALQPGGRIILARSPLDQGRLSASTSPDETRAR